VTAQPLVTIVTPSLNQGQYIQETIESVLSQDYGRIDYWVIDGRSSDNTLAILKTYDQRPNFHYCSEPDQGQAQAIQKGWQRSGGDILAWLNADDLYQPGAVSRAVAALVENPTAALVCGGAQVIDENGRPLGHIPTPYLSLTDLLGLVHFLPQPAVFMRADSVRQAGGLNANLNYAFDLDLFLRLASQAPIHSLDDDLARYRWHQQAKTAANFYLLRLEAAQVAQTFLQTDAGKRLPTHRRRLGYSHLVAGYANLRLGRLRPFLSHTSRGLYHSPANFPWLFRRAIKHLRQSKDPSLAYPYDPALP
jgi:glycosyltransferase involved in cell wall biosynthesis